MKNLGFLYNHKKWSWFLLTLILGTASVIAQPVPPPPGAMPPPGPTIQQGAPLPPPGPSQPGMQSPPPPAPPAPSGWANPGYLATPPTADWMNQGTVNVMATGYDTESVLVQIPLVVAYSYNGAFYDVTVLNAWSPLTQTWNIGVDTAAQSTSYYFNGFNYNYYVMLPSGTYYFNL
ncbi:MAG: hypothetical protein J1F16_08605 [Muribaculaceae bacterium]|nr:hypothetical protein [Muribaculaceae bacterium]